MDPLLPDEEEIRTALRAVIDPEAGMDVVELGLVYGIEIGEDAIRVAMTMTTPACPVADLLVDQAREAVARIAPAGVGVDVQLVWEPMWTPERMSDLARTHFGWK